MATTKSNFRKRLDASGEKIIATRAKMIETQTKRKSEAHVRQIEDEILDVQDKLLELDDFQRTSSTSLNPTNDSYDPEQYITQRNRREIKLVELNVKLDVAKRVHNELFG